jgi:integrase
MEYVLCHPDGRAIKCFRRLIGRALKQHKIFGVTPHGLRKTFCSLLARQKVHPKVAQELIGHSEIGLTMKVYTEVDDGQLAEAVNSLPTMQDWIKPQLKVVGGGRE